MSCKINVNHCKVDIDLNKRSTAGIIRNDREAAWSVYRMFPYRCEYDIVGRALEDIAILETESGSHGTLGAILRNKCWTEDRKRLVQLLCKVEELRHIAKRSSSKKLEALDPGALPRWSADWQKARSELVH